MGDRSEYQNGNALLDFLIASYPHDLHRDIGLLAVQPGDIVVGTLRDLEQVYFPVDTRISLTTIMLHGDEVEVGSIGSEGMIGEQLVLGGTLAPGRVLCQVGGTLAYVSADVFRAVLEVSPSAKALIQRYIQVRINSLYISIGCNALHTVEQRCARWLLTLEQHVRREVFVLTQEFLALMLGVRQATLNSVAQRLRERGYIRYSRGRMNIVDPVGLASMACECFGLVSSRYDELMKECKVPSLTESTTANQPSPLLL